MGGAPASRYIVAFETYDGCLQESGCVRFETTKECHVALDVHAILQKWNSYHFVSTPGKFSRKVSRNLIFGVRNESAKIMRLENLALYGSYLYIKIHVLKVRLCIK